MVRFLPLGDDSSRPPDRPTDLPKIDHASPAARAYELTIKFERVQFQTQDDLPRGTPCLTATYEIKGFVSLTDDQGGERDQDWEQFIRKMITEFGGGQNARPLKL